MLLVITLCFFIFSDVSSTVKNIEVDVGMRHKIMRKELTEYFEYIRNNINIHKSAHFCIYFQDNTTEARDTATAIMKTLYCPGMSITNYAIWNMKRIEFRASVMFVFIKDRISGFNHILGEILRMRIYNVRIYTCFVICEEIIDDTFIDQLLLHLWEQNFIRYVIVYFRKNAEMEIISYDPFRGNKKVFNKKTAINKLFPDLLNDLNGYKFRVSMFEDWPTMKRNPNGKWNGFDYDMLRVIVRTLNASFIVVEPPQATAFFGAHNDIVENRSDFCFVRYFQMNNFGDVEFSFSTQLDPIHVFVPTPPMVMQYSYMYLIFDREVWCAIAFTAFVVMLLLKIVTTYYYNLPNCTFFYIALEIWAIALSVSRKNLVRMKGAIKFVILPWIVVSLILSTAFQSILRNNLQFPKYQHGLECLSDLADHDVTIYSAINFTNITLDTPKLSDNIVIKTNEQIKAMCEASDYSGAYLIPFFSFRSPSKKHNRKETSYRMIAEPILTGHGVYMFKKNSPFLDKFNDMIWKLKENGIYSKIQESSFTTISNSDKCNPEKMSLFQLQGVFLALMVGFLIALIAFLREVVSLNIRKLMK
ncbi:hypothetical protein WA026_006652 [Henosepilachna vigintioctopunctata]|uniref:Ionotropic receptor n=1 Tax=Henosepilachna vigintioctopunctata TaxID=420089 RepID=A0AAW1UHA7_9CUCU